MDGRVARYRLRSGWRAVLLLALLVALVGGVVMTSVAGARRTTTAAARLASAGREPDVLIDATGVDPSTWDRIDALPSVESSAPVAVTFAFPADQPDTFPMLTRSDSADGRDLARGHLIAGRRADPGAADEVEVPESFAQQHQLEVGSTLSVVTASPATAEQLSETGEGELDGPAADLEVVGITRSTQDVADDSGGVAFVVLPPGFRERYEGDVAFVDGYFIAEVQGSEANLAKVAEELEAAYPEGEPPGVEPGGFAPLSLTDSLAVLAWGLYAFAGISALFGFTTIGLAVARSVAGRQPEQTTLAGLGMERADRLADAWAPTFGGGLLGAVGAVVVAAAASPFMPVGLARTVDPDLGLDLDLAVFLGGAVTTAAVVAALGAWMSWRMVRVSPGGSARARVASTRGLGALTGRRRPTVAIGLDMATGAGRGPAAVAVRTATIGVVAAVVGLAGVVVLDSSMERLLKTPDRYGWAWDVALAIEGTPTAEDVAERPGVEAVARAVLNQAVVIDGRSVYAMAVDPVAGAIGPTLAAGRAPVAPDEVALAADTRRALGDPDEVEVLDAEGAPVTFRVIGTAVVPTVDDPVPIADGAAFSASGLERLGGVETDPGSTGFERTLVRFEDGLDPEEAVAAAGLAEADPSFPVPPAEVSRLEQVSGLPRVLLVFLAAVAVLAVGHGLWQTVRARRHDLAVLRVVGFDRRQIAATVVWQAGAIAAVGALVGAALGVVLGRALWSLVAGNLGVAPDASVPAAIAGVALLVVALALAGGVVFGVIAGRGAPAAALHAE